MKPKRSIKITKTTAPGQPADTHLFEHGGHNYTAIKVRCPYHAGSARIGLDEHGAGVVGDSLLFRAFAVAENPDLLEQRFRGEVSQFVCALNDALDAGIPAGGVLLSDLAPERWSLDTDKLSYVGQQAFLNIALVDAADKDRFQAMIDDLGLTAGEWLSMQLDVMEIVEDDIDLGGFDK